MHTNVYKLHASNHVHYIQQHFFFYYFFGGSISFLLSVRVVAPEANIGRTKLRKDPFEMYFLYNISDAFSKS